MKNLCDPLNELLARFVISVKFLLNQGGVMLNRLENPLNKPLKHFLLLKCLYKRRFFSLLLLLALRTTSRAKSFLKRILCAAEFKSLASQEVKEVYNDRFLDIVFHAGCAEVVDHCFQVLIGDQKIL